MSYFPDNFGATGGTLEFGYPFSQNFAFTSPTTYTPFWSMAQYGLPSFTPAPIQSTYVPPAGLTPISEPFFYNPIRCDTDVNVSIQHEVDRTGAMEIAYVGTHSSHLWRFLSIDDLQLPAPAPPRSASTFYLTLPQVGNVVLGTRWQLLLQCIAGELQAANRCRFYVQPRVYMVKKYQRSGCPLWR